VKKGVVWYKKDLRVLDHDALSRASQDCDELIAVYIYEPEWLNSFEFDQSHLDFLNQSLDCLEISLRPFNIKLHRYFGSVIGILSEIKSKFDFHSIYAHEETGLDWTFMRDKAVAGWCRESSISFHEEKQFGVIRKLKNRDDWIEKRNHIINKPLAPSPRTQSRMISLEDHGKFQGYQKSSKVINLIGGEVQGKVILQSFLKERSRQYLEHISSPWFSVESSSRLSPYISYGNLSLRYIFQELAKKKKSLESQPYWLKSLEAFESRLWWHCHFIQKLETEPEIEFHQTNRAFDGMRESEFNEELFEAWKKGETGIPMIDASMRCLLKHSWLNFRMRAMLISFSSYQLWLHWKKPADFLAKNFLDFEPGIHFPQIQMQSGVTGINTIRIYSPTKQALDQKGGAEFIKHFCPELRELPDEFVHDPGSMPGLLAMTYNFKLGVDYPHPVIDERKAYHTAKERIFHWRQKETVKGESRSVLAKHASRAHRKFPRIDRKKIF